MKTALERIEEITEKEMIYNLHQIQHILNGLMKGNIYDGRDLDTEELLEYKLSVVKVLDIYNKLKNGQF